MKKEFTVRISYKLDGRVQGVGLRMTVHRLAVDAGLGGFVENLPEGTVLLVLEGTPLQIGEFITSLHFKLPAFARIDDITVINKVEIDPEAVTDFMIM